MAGAQTTAKRRRPWPKLELHSTSTQTTTTTVLTQRNNYDVSYLIETHTSHRTLPPHTHTDSRKHGVATPPSRFVHLFIDSPLLLTTAEEARPLQGHPRAHRIERQLTYHRTHRQVCRLADMGRHEGRAWYVPFPHATAYEDIKTTAILTPSFFTEFSGTLVGFDDYVSKFIVLPLNGLGGY